MCSKSPGKVTALNTLYKLLNFITKINNTFESMTQLSCLFSPVLNPTDPRT